MRLAREADLFYFYPCRTHTHKIDNVIRLIKDDLFHEISLASGGIYRTVWRDIVSSRCLFPEVYFGSLLYKEFMTRSSEINTCADRAKRTWVHVRKSYLEGSDVSTHGKQVVQDGYTYYGYSNTPQKKWVEWRGITSSCS